MCAKVLMAALQVAERETNEMLEGAEEMEKQFREREEALKVLGGSYFSRTRWPLAAAPPGVVSTSWVLLASLSSLSLPV